MTKVGAFVRLSRFPFLTGGFIGGALGTAVAAYERHAIDAVAYGFAQLAITGAHLMTQYANEYFDLESDALTTRTQFSGGSGVLVDGLLAPRTALMAALVCIALSSAGVLALALSGHALAAFLGVACLVLAWMYSAPPARLLARGLGELDTAFVVAVLVPLCAYAAQTGSVDLLAVCTTIPGAASMFAMMMCVQVPDVAADTATGKRNLMVRRGVRNGAALGAFAIVLAALGIGVARIAGAPQSYIVAEATGAIAMVWVVAGFAKLLTGTPIAAASIATRGVFAFAIVGICGVLGYVMAI